MTVIYNKYSPYTDTPIFNNFLDIWSNRTFPKLVDDELFTITEVYTYKPQLLSFDLYKTTQLWWVFAIRNPNVIKDPILDFVPGAKIYIPKKQTLATALGF